MLMADLAPYRRFRAPQEDGQTLVEPPRAALAEVVERNRQHVATLEYEFQGRSLSELAASARHSLVERASAYTRQYRDIQPPPADAASRPLVLSGHQPQLFHAGVWYKNFVLGSLAREVDGLGVHLLIDSDLCRTASIRIPTGTVDRPRMESIEFDGPGADVPYEERAVVDEAAFDSFAGRVAERIRSLVAEPVIEEFWRLVRDDGRRERNLGLRLAHGRHRLEAEWGNDTLELPQSAVCQLPEFGWFVAHLLAHLPRFWAAHNDALADYRRAHHLRNRAQPVPDLAEADGWLEAPFWMWTADDPRRQPVFARQQGDQLLLSDRHQHTVALALSADGEAATAVGQLADLADRGIKLRTRALATTLFARLLASDLFLHGIGGAKYDQVTDQIAERFFGVSLPVFATASATLRLPIGHERADQSLAADVRRQLREFDYHPERFLPNNGEAGTAIVGEKRRWLETAKTATNAGERHRAIVAANAALQPLVADRRAEIERKRVAIEARLLANSILDSREFAFCLFPREHLQRLMQSA